MGFKESWQRWASNGEVIVADVNPSKAYKARSALLTLYASDYGYDDWKDIGISFKAAGGELSDWLSWCSIDATRYDERVATRLYESVDQDGPITENTLWKRAWDAGWRWRERYESVPIVRMVPEPEKFDGGSAQAIAQLEAMFCPDEYVNIVTEAAKNKKGKWCPARNGKFYRRSELCDAIRERGLEAAIGGYNHEAGVWLRVNPMTGDGTTDKDVSDHRHTLVESDDMSLKDQERMLYELNLPIVCITNSGGKSLHAVVRVDADGPNHFSDIVYQIHGICGKSGFTIDSANKNPGRLTRLAGVERGEREQTLMHLKTGAKDFSTWLRQEHKSNLTYDYGIEPMDMETPPVLDEVLVDGVMRRGDKMCVSGPSKSYKSFALVQLAIAIACGGRWFGWKCKKGRVLYINCELRGESFRKRVWEVSDKMPCADRAQIAANMDVWNMRGRTQPLDTGKDHIIEQAEARSYDVVILDPIYKLFDGDENSAEDVSEFMLAMDELAMRLHASIVYCHHHSKGAKGGTNAQDRFSGSGVFARDCDELVDISPLDLKDSEPTDWGFDAMSTAWRIETVIRDFAPKPPLDAMFEYPVHVVDETGYLSEFAIFSPQAAGGRARGEQRKEAQKKNADELETYCRRFYRTEPSETLTAKGLADEFDVSPKTIVSWANKAHGLRVVKVGTVNTIVLMERR